MKRRWVRAAIVGALVAIAAGGLVWSRLAHNPARAESHKVSSLLEETGAVRYCENGGKGPTYGDPWWETIVVADLLPAQYAPRVASSLTALGYDMTITHIVDSTDDGGNKGKTYWELTGRRGRYTVTARVSSHELTLNNCFPRFNDTAPGVSPEEHASVVVVLIHG